MRSATKILSAATAVALASLFTPHAVRAEPGEGAGKPDRAAVRAKMLKRIDTDGDGKMSREELAAAKAKAQAAEWHGGGPPPANHRLEVVTFPEEVRAADSNMGGKALLYHPIKKDGGRMPLVVLLHGAGGTKKADISAFKGSRDVAWIMSPANSKYVAKILVPRSTSHWNPTALNRAVAHLLKADEEIDPDRIYCIGYSMGGLGTWNWAKHSPERLAAIVPVAFIANQDGIEKMVDLPIWAMVGTADRRRAGSIPAMEKALKKLGSKVVRTTVFDGANHATTARLAWGQEGLLDWLFAQSRTK